jgi:tetratricopeptide (TPR) repeat protein
MPTKTNALDAQPPALVYARLLILLHRLIGQGLGDSEEAEATADQMDSSWYALSAQEQTRMRGLAADLHALREGGPKRVNMLPEQLANWKRELKEARTLGEAGDVDAFLSFLRQPVPVELPAQVIPFLQAGCWEKFGDLETALEFMREADRLDPDQALSVLVLLQKLGYEDEFPKYANRVIKNPVSPPLELYVAAVALMQPSRRMSDADAKPILQQIVPVLKRSLKSYLALPLKEREECPDADAHIAQALGLCLERLGDVKSAIGIYSEALSRHPRDGQLFMARGLALYGENSSQALEDFTQAVRWGVAAIWPYLLLARRAFQVGTPGQARRLALLAEKQPGPAVARAEAYELIGMALAELGQPQERVMENFDRALALDPNNDRISQNREIARAPVPKSAGGRPARRRLLSAHSIDSKGLRQARTEEINMRIEEYNEKHSNFIGGVLSAV